MNEFRFAEPGWASALWGVAAFIALLFWLDRRGGSALDRLVGPALQERLVIRPASWRRTLRLVFLGLGALCLVLAMMRPQWGMRHIATPEVGAEIMVALDVSRSMLAEDVAPNRLERAKAEIADLLTYLRGDQVGLIAFAGRATVLAPLTPDFGFLRLVLDGAGPHSVQRGGTKIGEPIRKAIAGFGSAGETSRALLLITDGEDHDSFPLDAAKQAAELGIKVIAVGFGDEAGSEIYITDPRTGARNLLRDGDGRPVRSRLDGELLRDIARTTSGAYVPAGTGVLDLESIYEQHIARLTRGAIDPRGRVVRDEVYQWAVLAGLVFLIASAAVASGPARSAALVACFALAFAAPDTADAQPQNAPGAADAAGESAGAPAGPPLDPDTATADAAQSDPSETDPAAEKSQDPRELYNRGLTALVASDHEAAALDLSLARREAKGDGELRFRAAYNLGMSAFARAEAGEADAPNEALSAFYEAADWFRDAIRQQPEHEDSRYNLEVALRRGLLLADRIAQQNERKLEEEIDALAAGERELLVGIAQLIESLAADPDLYAADRLRGAFRGRATLQRTLLSDADGVAERAGREKDAFGAFGADQLSPEDQMRGAQLDGVLHYLHRARERMGQARRQLRQRQADRAYRRASAALAELKRARDQLRDPVETLDVLLRDAAEVHVATQLLAADGRAIPGRDEPVAAPAWLSLEGAREDQQSVAERTSELDTRLAAGLDQEPAPDAPPEQTALLESAREAAPFLNAAASRLSRAADSLEASASSDALEHQREGIQALAEARERFFDLRRLIEAAHGDEQRIAAIAGAEGDVAEQRDEFLPSLRGAQTRNIARSGRIASKLAAELAALQSGSAAPAAPGAPPPDAETLELQRQRFEIGSQLIAEAQTQMQSAQRALGSDDDDRADWAIVETSAAEATQRIDALRRLFFSLVEALRDVAQRQLDLADATQDAVALTAGAPDDAAAAFAPLVPRQSQLAGESGEIAGALAEQADQSGGVVDEDEDGEAAETSRRLRVAAEHVVTAQTEMEGASGALAAEPARTEESRQHQDAALVELRAALELLVPPEERNQDQGQQQQQQQDGEQPQEPEGAEQTGDPQDPAQLLQAVRDREAQRRRDRDRRPPGGYDTVERDW